MPSRKFDQPLARSNNQHYEYMPFCNGPGDVKSPRVMSRRRAHASVRGRRAEGGTAVVFFRSSIRARTHKSRLFGNRWLPQTTCAGLRRNLKRPSSAVATSREGHRSPGLGPDLANDYGAPKAKACWPMGLASTLVRSSSIIWIGSFTRRADDGVAPGQAGPRKPLSGPEDPRLREGLVLRGRGRTTHLRLRHYSIAHGKGFHRWRVSQPD
jgi:hypothetical protein